MTNPAMKYKSYFNFCTLLVQSRLGNFSQASLFVCFVQFFLIYLFWSCCYYYIKLPEIQVFLILVDANPVELWTRIHSAKKTNIMISTVNMSI